MCAVPSLDPALKQSRNSGNQYAVLEFAFVVLLMMAAFTLRIWSISKVHFWDEAVYLQNAEVICCGKANYSELASRPPLLSLIFAAVFLLWHHVYAACIATALLNALECGVVCFTARRAAKAGEVPSALQSRTAAQRIGGSNASGIRGAVPRCDRKS
jgi:hypothetical protein